MSFTDDFEQNGRSTGSESRYDDAQGFRSVNPNEGMYGSDQGTNIGQGRTGDLNFSQGEQRSISGQGGPGGEFNVSSFGGSGLQSGNREDDIGRTGLTGQRHDDQLNRAAQVAFGGNPGGTMNSGRGSGLDNISSGTGFNRGSGPTGGQFSDDFVPSPGLSGLNSNRAGFGGTQVSSNDFVGGERDVRSREQLGNRESERTREQDKPLSDQISNLKRDIETSGSSQNYKQGPRDSSF